MATHPHHSFDPLLTTEGAARMVRICEQFGSFKMYSEEPTFKGLIGEGLPARWDAARNFVKTGGRFGRNEPLQVLAARTNYFRETYAYGDEERVEGIEPFLHHEGFVEAARAALRPPDHRAGDRVRESARPRTGARRPHRRAGVPRRQSQAAPAVADRGHAPLRALRAVAHADRDRRVVVPRLRRRRVRLLSRRRRGAAGRAPGALQHRAPAWTPTPSSTASIASPRPRRRSTSCGPACGSATPATAAGAWPTATRRSPSTAGTSSATRSRGRPTASPTRPSNAPGSSNSDDLSVAKVVDRLVEDLRERGIITGERPSDTVLVDLLIDSYVHYPQPAGR